MGLCRCVAGIASTVAIALFGAASAQAIVYEVDTPTDTASGNCITGTPSDCPLRRAVDLANGTMADDEIVLTTNVQLNLPGEENLNVNGDIDISADTGSGSLTLRSDTGMRKIDKSGVAGNIRILDVGISNAKTVTIEDVEITGGNFTALPSVGGGGINFVAFGAGDTLRLDNVFVHGNTVGGGAGQQAGGGVAATGTGLLEIVNGSRIEGNKVADAIAGANGIGGGVAARSNIDLTVSNSTVSGNRAGVGVGPNGARGGGVYFSSDAGTTPDLNVTNSQISNNRAGGQGSTGGQHSGGGIDIRATTGGSSFIATVSGGSVGGNTVAGGNGNAQGSGGGISSNVDPIAGGGQLTLTNVAVSGNRAGGSDGITNPTMSFVASGFGGGIATNAETQVTGGSVSGNFAGVSATTAGLDLAGAGAGIQATDGPGSPDLSVSGTSLDGNTAGNLSGGSGSTGGAITSINSGALTVTGATITGNSVRGFGGGIYRIAPGPGAADAVTATTIAGNTAGGNNGGAGGGINIETPRSITINRSLISDNHAPGSVGQGGGIQATSPTPAPTPLGKLTLTNSTVTGNSAGLDTPTGSGLPIGGGINLGATAPMDFSSVFSTITDNTMFSGTGSSATHRRGGNFASVNNPSPVPSLSFTGTIVSGGAATGTAASAGNCSPGNSAPITSVGGNLEGLDAVGSVSFQCAFVNTGQGDQSGIDPLLGPLADNGGPTGTRILLPGSPAINAVSPAICAGVTVDQRNQPRPFGAQCDVGAHELGDRDGDGILDNVDNCPTQAGPASNGGCPLAVTPITPITPITPTTPKTKCPKGKKAKKVKGKVKCVKKRKKKKK